MDSIQIGSSGCNAYHSLVWLQLRRLLFPSPCCYNPPQSDRHSVTFSKGLVKIITLCAIEPKVPGVNLIGKNRSRQLFSLRNGYLTYTVMLHLIIHIYIDSLEDIYNFHLIFLHLISSPLAAFSIFSCKFYFILIFFF